MAWRPGAFLRLGLAATLLVTAAALAARLSRGARRGGPLGAEQSPAAHAREGSVLHGAIQEFSILGAYRDVMRCDPFRFHCPLPLFDKSALRGMDGATALKSCCHDYNAMPFQWPYQFPECGAGANCSTCFKQSGEPKLLQHPVAGMAALAFATSLAVSGPRRIEPRDLEAEAERRLSDETRHAGLPFKQILASVQYGLRAHYSNVCPLINDWEEYYLNDEEENTHARVYRSASAKLAIVAFRGTQPNSGKNWATDADAAMVSLQLEENGTSANVHEGFETALKRVLPHIRKWVEGYANGVKGMWQVPSDWKLLFTGHSLGGALATLAATHAEVEGWRRRVDAVVTYGSPRVADGNLSSWWQRRGLCKKLLRVNVHNDVVHWMPFTMGANLLNSVFSCANDLSGCWGKVHDGLNANAKMVQFSQRWTHVCPESEFEVPGALKGVNSQLWDFSPLGGALAHFLSNGLFGYGYGVVQGGIFLHDMYCGLTPSIFPQFECSVIEDLTGVRCLDLDRDEVAADAQTCRNRCCDDPYCEVWQFMRDGSCWRGRSHECRVRDPRAADVVVGERVK